MAHPCGGQAWLTVDGIDLEAYPELGAWAMLALEQQREAERRRCWEQMEQQQQEAVLVQQQQNDVLCMLRHTAPAPDVFVPPLKEKRANHTDYGGGPQGAKRAKVIQVTQHLMSD